MAQRNIYLTGFMGTGKTTIGRELAKATGKRFIDMDREIESRFGMSVSEIFAAYGDPFYREQEKRLAFELVEKRNYVVSTGGGTIMDPEIFKAFIDNGLMICLTAKKKELLLRLRRTNVRPLLQVENFERRVDELLKERSLIFNAIPIKVDTSDLSPIEVVSKLVKLFKIRQTVLMNMDSELSI